MQIGGGTMRMTVTPEEAATLRRGLCRLIKHKESNVKNIMKNLEKDPADAEVTAIRRGMLERRERSIAQAKSLLEDLNHVSVEE